MASPNSNSSNYFNGESLPSNLSTPPPPSSSFNNYKFVFGYTQSTTTSKQTLKSLWSNNKAAYKERVDDICNNLDSRMDDYFKSKYLKKSSGTTTSNLDEKKEVETCLTQPTATSSISPTFFWCYHCQTTNHPPEKCPLIGYSLGLGQTQFNYFHGPTSEPYQSNFNAKCWNHQQISVDQSIQNLQSNWSFPNPSLQSCEHNNNFEETQTTNPEFFPELTSQLEALKNIVAQTQANFEATQKVTQSNSLFNEPSPIEENFDETEPIFKNQIQENQVNQFFTPQDSTPHCNTISESSSSPIQLTQFEEFEQNEQADEEQEEDEIMHDLKFLLQISAKPVITPELKKYMCLESSNGKSSEDIFKKDSSSSSIESHSEQVDPDTHIPHEESQTKEHIEQICTNAPFFFLPGDDLWKLNESDIEQFKNPLDQFITNRQPIGDLDFEENFRNKPMCLDDLFNDELVTNTTFREHCEHECNEIVDEPLFFNKLLEDESDNISKPIIVEEQMIFPIGNEEVVCNNKIPFEEKQIDLKIFTFNEKSTNKFLDDNVKDKNFGETIEDEINLCEKHVGGDFWSDNKLWFLDELFEVESDHSCVNICVEKPKSKIPFERRKLDLSIFTFDEPTNDKSIGNKIQEPLIDQSCGDEMLCLSNPVRDELVNYTSNVEFSDLYFEVIFEDELNSLGDDMEDVPNMMGDSDNFHWENRRKRNKRRLRKTKNKLERMRARINKRLTSDLSPLKRTHWNDGKRSRGWRPRRNFMNVSVHM